MTATDRRRLVGGDQPRTWESSSSVLYEAGCFGNSSSDLNWAAIGPRRRKQMRVHPRRVTSSCQLPCRICDIISARSHVPGTHEFGVHRDRRLRAYGFVFGKPVQEPQFECRLSYDWCRRFGRATGIARRIHRRQNLGGMDGDRATRSTAAPPHPTKTRPSFAEGLGDGILARPRASRALSSPCKPTWKTPKAERAPLPLAKSNCIPNAWQPSATHGPSTTATATSCDPFRAISPKLKESQT